jgi:cytochrome c nitrite reductase small subunit
MCWIDQKRFKEPAILNSNLLSRRRIVIFWSSLALLGSAFGLGIYTFMYAKGSSYLSDNPTACANCHVMREVLTDWQRGDHHHVAVCNDCHVPQSFVSKWLVKGMNGFHHSYAFTFLETPVTIRAASLSGKVVQKNCERCHESLLSDHITRYATDKQNTSDQLPKCIQCHREVGHIH